MDNALSGLRVNHSNFSLIDDQFLTNGTVLTNDEKSKLLWIKYATTVIYLTIFVFGIIGNTLTIYVIVCNPNIRNKSVSNYYILNLATADELYVATMPLYAYVSYTNNWVFGNVVCKVSTVLRECNKSASVMTLMALSVDRYLATFHNVGRFRQIRFGIGVSAAVWAISLACATPQMIYAHTVRNADSQVACWPLAIRQMSPHIVRQLWVYGNLVLGTLLPFAVIATFNLLLVRRLRIIARSSSASDRNNHLRSRMSSSMLRLVLAIVVIFVACQLPYHVIEAISLSIFERIQFQRQTISSLMKYVFIYFNSVAQVLVFVSSCCNPILYGIFNKNYRNLYLQVLCCRRKKASDQSARRESTFGALLVVSRDARMSLEQRVVAAPAGSHRCGCLSRCFGRRRRRRLGGSGAASASAALGNQRTATTSVRPRLSAARLSL